MDAQDRDPPGHVERLLAAARAGEPHAQEELWSAVYGELHRLAHARRASLFAGDLPETTSLVHEAYLRLGGRPDFDWQDLQHFYGAAGRAMRNILVDELRRRNRRKRQPPRPRITLEAAAGELGDGAPDVLALDVALERLERHDPRLAELVTLRYFAGLTTERTATLLNVSAATYHRLWSYAKAWLLRELGRQAENRAEG